MINEIRQEILLSPELRKKINWAIKYASCKVNIINGALIRLEPTNIAYIEPHKIIINNTTLLFFNGTDNFYINNLENKYKLNELDKYLKLAISN
jgi:hypothetical protein